MLGRVRETGDNRPAESKMRDTISAAVRLLTGRSSASYLLHFSVIFSDSRRTNTHIKTFSVLLTRFPHLIFAVSQQFKDVHLQLAGGRAVRVFVDAFFGQRDGQTLPPAALHGVIKDGR